jgi:hypothetical protein
MDRLRARFYQVSAYNHRLAMLLVELGAEFEHCGIPFLALKGPAVAMAAYGDLCLRQYEDIDILVRVGDVSRAVELFSRCGFSPAPGHSERSQHVKLYHEVTWSAPDGSYSVDLHWQLAPPYARIFGPDSGAVWARAGSLRLPFGDVPVLGREDLFLALCQHGTRHRWWQLKWLFDVGELLQQSGSIAWASIEDVFRTHPMARPPACLAMTLARDLLGIKIPPGIHRMLQPSERTYALAQAIGNEFLACGQTNRSAHDTLLGLEHRSLVRARYMAGEAIQYPLKEILFTITEKDLQFVRLPEKLRFLYYCIRPLRLLVQHGRAAARRIWSMAR